MSICLSVCNLKEGMDAQVWKIHSRIQIFINISSKHCSTSNAFHFCLKNMILALALA